MKIDKSYVSEIDRFLHDFDRTHPLSESQRQEINKHAAIFTRRDDPSVETQNDLTGNE